MMIVLVIGMVPSVWADDSTDEKQRWQHMVELGAVQTSGNTHTVTVNTKAKSIYASQFWRTTVAGNAVNASANQLTTAEKYSASFQEDWRITARDYFFLRADFDSDRFAGFARRFTESVGYGRQWIDAKDFLWNGEVGGGFRQVYWTSGLSTFETIARIATDIDLQLSEATTFTQDITSEGGVKGWTSKSVTSLRTALNAHVSSNISLTLNHNSRVPAATRKLDAETSVTLGLSF